MEGKTWAETFHDHVVGWVRPYTAVGAMRGYAPDDLAQEGRLALVCAQEFIERSRTDCWGNARDLSQTHGLCRLIVKRAVKRKLFGKRVDDFHPKDGSHSMIEDRLDREKGEHDLYLTIEMAEMVDAAPEQIKGYLADLFSGRLPMSNREYTQLSRELRAAAAEYVLEWVSRYNWSHES